MINIDFNKLEIKKLNENINLNDFDCGNYDLNEFIKKDSFFQMDLMLNTTYVMMYENIIIGFFTLSTNSVSLKNLGSNYKELFSNKDINYKSFPSITIARLGVDIKYQNYGIGQYIIDWAILNILNLSENVGIRFINIDSYITAINFYKKNYFKISPEYLTKLERIYKKHKKAIIVDKTRADKMTIPMFFDLYKYYPNEKNEF
jgi:hypothetical protein